MNNLQEIIVQRDKTSTYGGDAEGIPIEAMLSILTNLKVIQNVECIQKLIAHNETNFEITFKSPETKTEADSILKHQTFGHNGVIIKCRENRELKDLVRNPVIKVTIFEAPFELQDRHILTKLSQYGDLTEQYIVHHQIRGTQIYNGIRSITFKKITTPIPTTLFIRGNRIKLKHAGQDRAPICGLYKTKGHYRDDCPGNSNDNGHKEN